MTEEKKAEMISDVKYNDGMIAKPAEFESPDALYEELISCVRKYHPSDDVTKIAKAYEVAKAAHTGQVRKSGEPYIIHPLNVAIILAELEMDKETIIAGLLHDVVEDTAVTQEELESTFGSDVALLVDGVTKLEKIPLSAEIDQTEAKLEMQAENLRKMFLAMAKDIRVILIKLADRLHNMRTLQYQKPESQQRIARETLEIYCPIAQRLGISKIKVELDDLSLKYLYPDAYRDLVNQINMKKAVREQYIQGIVDEVRKIVEEGGIPAKVDGRVKHFFSIYKKMKNQNKTLDQIYDLFAVRVIVDSVKDCYAVLGLMHEKYKPIPGRFKDYIGMPKANMYQSLHTTLIGNSGQPFEIQIRTAEMHKAAEYGIAAHWKYKEASDGKRVEAQEEEKLVWLRQILEWQQDTSDNREFMNLLKNDLDLFADQVYCFTPKGEVKNLPAGSTPIDFAYSIHSAVGNKMVGARVNGRIVTIDYKIKNGDRIEILTSGNCKGPSQDWLNIVKSTQAKNKINQWFKSQEKDDNISKGKDLLMAYCRTKAVNIASLMSAEYMDAIMKRYGMRDWDSVLAAVGHGAIKEGQVIGKLQEYYDRDHRRELTNEEIIENIAVSATQNANKAVHVHSKGGVLVKGIADLSVRFSKCCSPVPGDEIVGFVTRGRGISIHRSDCVNMLNLPEIERTRVIEAEWEEVGNADRASFPCEIKLYAFDKQGLLADISKVFTEKNINITAMSTRTNRQGKVTMQLCFAVTGTEILNELMGRLRSIENVVDIERSIG